MQISIPKHPTHAVQHIDNWDGERNVMVSLVFRHEGVYHYHESGKPVLLHDGDEILQEWPLTKPSDENATQQEKTRFALLEATDILEREFLPALEDKDELSAFIQHCRVLLSGDIDSKSPMLQVFLPSSELQKFEETKDLHTLLVFMAGSAIRSRMALVRDYEAKAKQGFKAAPLLLVEEKKIVSDFCRIIALCEESNASDVEASFKSITDRIFNE